MHTFIHVSFTVRGEALTSMHIYDTEPSKKYSCYQKGKWYHVAFGWKGEKTYTYLDGKLMQECKQRNRLDEAELAEDAVIILGDKYSRANPIALDEFRISSILRPPEELGYGNLPLKPDAYTLILDSFEKTEEQEKKQYSVPEFIANKGDVPGGLICGKVEYIEEGKHGKAIRWHE
jgi:hypothetical protein